jgi:nucleoid-associated protein YgaU
MKNAIWLLGLCFVLSGCVVRTYTMTKDRVDQDLSSGNKGYLQGSGPTESVERSKTRDTQVLEVEFGPRSKTKKQAAVTSAPVAQESAPIEEGNRGYITETAPEAPVAPACEEYKVQKGDTLQKISEKFYGTTKRWTKIFEANKDKIKAPDKIRVGQTICVPAEGKIEVKETQENLK